MHQKCQKCPSRLRYNVGTCLRHVSLQSAMSFNASPNMPKACPYAMALSFWEIDTQTKANQRDGSFGLYMPKAYQKNRPFGLRGCKIV